MRHVTFMDFEASAMNDGYPIEIGWATLDSETFEIVSQSHLIRPTAEWLEDSFLWSERSEQVHGISLDELLEHGLPAEKVCQLTNEALKGQTVYSDAAPFDGAWLEQLFEAGHVDKEFSLSSIDELKAYVDLATAKKAEKFATETCPRTHRAKDDAEHWATYWREVKRAGC